jgi:hypothetical protein
MMGQILYLSKNPSKNLVPEEQKQYMCIPKSTFGSELRQALSSLLYFQSSCVDFKAGIWGSSNYLKVLHSTVKGLMGKQTSGSWSDWAFLSLSLSLSLSLFLSFLVCLSLPPTMVASN